MVCWVDIIFARLADVVLLVLQDRGSKDNSESVFQTIAKHRSEAGLHAAAQLPRTFSVLPCGMKQTVDPRAIPDSWEDTVEMMSSEYASPAATRLVIRLLYVAYVAAPSCGAVPPWTENG